MYNKNSAFNWHKCKLGLEEGVTHLCETVKTPFKLDWAIKTIKSNCKIFNPHPDDLIKHLLDSSEYLGMVHGPVPAYFPACYLFENTSFRIQPTISEIEAGILILGDSLTPYFNKNLAIEHLQFSQPNESNISIKKVNCEYKDLNKWFLNINQFGANLIDNLLSNITSDNLEFDTNFIDKLFTANNLDGDLNCTAKNHFYLIPALEIKNIYQKNNFRAGDSILFKVKDYHTGIFEISVLKASPKTNFKFRCIEFENQIERYIYEEINETATYPTAIKSLLDCYARMRLNGIIINEAPTAWLRYLQKVKKLGLINVDHVAVLYKNPLTVAKKNEIVQELSWSYQKMESLEDMLEILECDLKIDILKVYAQNFIDLKKGNQNVFFDYIFKKFNAQLLNNELSLLFNSFADSFWQSQLTHYNVIKNSVGLSFLDEALNIYENCVELYNSELSLQDGLTDIDRLQTIESTRLVCELIMCELIAKKHNLDQAGKLNKNLKEISQNLRVFKL